MNLLNRIDHDYDVCIIGGGMAGLCAAIASARHGAKTILVHDRPVLGGNASSEIRMGISGAYGKNNKETGLLEEIQLENQYRNASGNYSIWDSVLYEHAQFQPNLTLLLNCSCTNAIAKNSTIQSITAWQLTSQTWHTVHARRFIDCSGDSILAAVTGAEFRTGREAREEFDESIAPTKADKKTMGDSLLIQLRRTESAQPFTPPVWAYKFTSEKDLPSRISGVQGGNFWWIEIGGLKDTIADAGYINNELMKIVWGVWDYIKNHAEEKYKATNWAIEWIGFLPGKRENRRYVGDHILMQNELLDGGNFNDTIAFGGWPLDDHHPAGILYPAYPNLVIETPSPYGIPYRSIYSKNINNLLFAGRNISVTHAALSSTRVMATCAIIGQAAGTAAALSVKHNCQPRAFSSGQQLNELQNALMDDDCFLPGFARKASELVRSAKLISKGANSERLIDGIDRDRDDLKHAWQGATGMAIEFQWQQEVDIAGVRMVFDSNLANSKRMPHVYPQNGSRCAVPKQLVKQFRIEALDGAGSWQTVYKENENHQRLVLIPINTRTKALRLIPEQTWGDDKVRIFNFEPLDSFRAWKPKIPEGVHISEVRKQIAPEDLEPSEAAQEAKLAKASQSA